MLALFGLTTFASGQTASPGFNTWSSSGPGTAAYSLAVDPGNPNVVYAGGVGGVFKSADGGATWSATGLAGDTVALAADSTNSNILYAGIAERNFCTYADHRLFKSADGGATWSALDPRINGCDNIHALVLAPSDPNTLYVADYDDSTGDTPFPLIRSTDGGAAWSEFMTWMEPGVPPFAALAIDPRSPNILYAGGYENGVFKSTDGGAHWSNTGLTNTGVNVLAVDPLNPNVIYAATSGLHDYPAHPDGFRGLFKSADGGASWLAVNNGLPDLSGDGHSVIALVIDPDGPNVLYAGTNGDGVFKSADGGASWNALNDGLTNRAVQALVMAPGNPNTLYAGTPAGVFKIVEETTAANQIDDSQFFVRQHYLDFLSREPDDAGLQFWTNEIASCGDDAQCREVKRINVSAAFFLSIEFQQTGYLVDRFYLASFGRRPRLPEFTPDSRAVSQGVVVNSPGWEQQLETNKQAFADEFVARPRFTDSYPAALTPEQFVDQLNANAGGALSQDERDSLVGDLYGNAKTRAQVLRAVAEDPDMVRREFDPAFVLMQYYGYLRRNPDDMPDGNMGGYDFWLSKLDGFGGDFSGAEMVKAFISSTEYRQRFGRP
jgi:photosystem II stability/assembly factor-like uncharacterized protein